MTNQRKGFHDLIELFDEIRRYVIKLDTNDDISREIRMDLCSSLDTLKEDLVLFNSDNILTQIVDSIIGVVRPFAAKDGMRCMIYLNRSFREYREFLRGASRYRETDRRDEG